MNVDNLISTLSNFYQNFSNEDNLQLELFKAYCKSFKEADKYMSAVERNADMPGSEIYRKIPIAVIDVYEAQYNLFDMLNNNSYFHHLGTAKPWPSSPEGRLEVWEASSLDEKTTMLTAAGRYVILNTSTNVMQQNGPVINCSAYDKDNVLLVEEKDYVIRNNNLFLFGKLSKQVFVETSIILRDIMVDYDMTYNLIGSYLGLRNNDIFSKSEYKDISYAFLKAVIKGPTIKNMKEALRSVFGNEDQSSVDTFNLIDKYTEGGKKTYWEEGAISPFDFVLDLPIEYPENKINILRDYIHLLKPPETNYITNKVLFGGSATGEMITITDQVSINSVIGPFIGSIPVIDEVKIIAGVDLKDAMDVQFQPVYDVGFTFDQEEGHFDNGRKGPISINSVQSRCSVIYNTFPEIPIKFSGRRLSSALVQLSFANNCRDSHFYEVYENEKLITTIALKDVKGDSTISISVRANRDKAKYTVRSCFRPFRTNPNKVMSSMFTSSIEV